MIKISAHRAKNFHRVSHNELLGWTIMLVATEMMSVHFGPKRWTCALVTHLQANVFGSGPACVLDNPRPILQ